MKVQLIVVQGKPEGKTIPLLGSRFKIGRGETCHLRPNSEQVSREHAEFVVGPTSVTVTDLGSRNGTLVNGRAIAAAQALRNGDLVQVGPLTFAVSIQGAPPEVVTKTPASSPAAPGKVRSLDDVSNDEIDAWLIADKEKPTPESPSGVYGGDTITISAFKDASTSKNAMPAATPIPVTPIEDNDEGYERDAADDEDSSENENQDDEDSESQMPDEMIDENNPFYVKKAKAPETQPGTAKQVFKDTSDAATDILRKMMERRRPK